MGIQADDLSGGSLTGTLSVSGGQILFDQTVLPIDFEGNKVFNILLRRDNENGVILYQTSNITLIDNSQITSCLPNTTTVSEGGQVNFTVTSQNIFSPNITLYYSTSGNVTYDDFVGGNVGYFYLLDGNASIVLTANSDLSNYVDKNEQFTLQLRKNSISGDILFTSNTAVTVIDSSNSIAIASIVESTDSLFYGNTFTFTTTASFIPEGAIPVYYKLEGNAVIDSPASSGQLVFSEQSNVLTIVTNVNTFVDGIVYLTIRRDSAEGQIIATSNTINIVSIPIMQATGGTTYFADGYKYHLFTTGGTFAITSSSPISPLNSIEYISLAGGGGGGAKRGGGGGAGGLISGSLTGTPSTSITISVGGGGSGGLGGEGTRGVSGTPTTLTGSVTATAIGGGSGGCGGPFPSPSFTGDGAPGGSGGGGGRNDGTPASGGSGTPGQGNNAGGTPSPNAGSGGGGAGGVGAASYGPTNSGGEGGAGITTYNPWFTNSPLGAVDGIAGGGGGGGPGSWPGPTGANPPGGLGGGGKGGYGTNAPPIGYSTAGRASSGSGGGGGGNSINLGPGTGRSGGGGLVLLRYPISLQ